ncbi:hypothetical protein J4E89_008092 [Alternaria sp. Ai002NY15]|nr:hypothetical protein J4E89_008092 [Alternaria sp. Ai002NY15]
MNRVRHTFPSGLSVAEYTSGEISESEKVPTMTSDNVVESRSDATPTKLDESSAAPTPGTKDDKSQSEDASVAEASPDAKGKASIKSEHNGNDDSDADKEDLSDGTDVDVYLERYRSKYDNMTARIKLAPKRVKQTHQYTAILEERLSLLEDRAMAFDKKLRRIEDGKDELPPPPDDDEIYLKPELNFLLSKGLKPVPGAPKVNETHEIDVFVGEPEVQKGERFRRRKTQSTALEDDGVDEQEVAFDPASDRTPQSIDDKRLKDEIGKAKNKQFPNRVRFNAEGVVYLLRKYLGGNNGSLDDIVLRPFKPLLQNKEEILNVMFEVVSALTRIVNQRGRKGAELVADSKSSEEAKDVDAGAETQWPNVIPALIDKPGPIVLQELRNAPDAITTEDWDIVLKELDLFDEQNGCSGENMKGWPNLAEVERSFGCFKSLLDDYLIPGHMEYRERKAKRVRFCDLWHVFQTGDLVVTKRLASLDETETQDRLGMRVLMTAGGRRVIMSKLPAPILPSPVNLSTSKDRIEPINGVNPFCIHAYYLDFNGSRMVPVRRRIVIAPYNGERNISDLEVVPIEYAASALDSLEKRGQKFVKAVTATTAPYVDCKGLELRTREELNDRVIVDMKSYFGRNPGEIPSYQEPEELDISETSDCPLGTGCNYASLSCYHRTTVVHDQMTDLAAYQEYIDEKPVFNPLSETPKVGLIEPSDFSICHYRVFAYKLRSREWVHVNVKHLEPPQEIDRNRGFEKLVLSEDHKHILESQVREHFRKKGSQAVGGSSENDMDLVRGKGQGLIILLHGRHPLVNVEICDLPYLGAPGVGKTATAECIADLMEKPLYPITCGDLGSSAEDVEKNLKKHFTLASRWDCVMLLDEADVFLAKRKLEDLQRNSIVSVFLRMLEYYKGLLFLTTNRVDPNFDKETTLKVWKTFIDQTKFVLESSGRTNVTVDAEGIEKFAKKHWKENKQARWNGRQIRNAFHTAVAMAEFGVRSRNASADYDDGKDVKISVGRTEFEKIANTAKEFGVYMTETMGDPDFVASRDGLRKQQKEPKEKTKKKKKKKQSKSKKQSESSSSESESEDEDESDSD